MAIFTVLNGTGINGTGVQFGSIGSSIAAGGIAGNPNMSGATGFINLVGGGKVNVTGAGLSFSPPSTFGGTVDSMTYEKSAINVFSITGMCIPLATLAGLVTGGDENTILATIFSGNDRIFGSTQADILKGYDGDDLLRGGAGADNLDGGNGLSDSANYQGSDAAVFVDLKDSLFSGGHATGDVLTNIENIYGSSFGDTLTGSDIRNIIGGENGDDVIKGNGGDDSLAGEAGVDTIDGNDGNDRVVGGAGADILHGNAGNDSMDGGTEDDQIFGDDGNDSMTGGAGADSLDGGEGNDILEGGAGADTLTGGNGIDSVSYASAAGPVVVVLGGVSTGGDAAGDTMSGIEQVLGSSFADTITGDANANTMWGLGGDDILIGGAGADVLKGGAGNDSFTYVAIGDSTVATAGKDTVVDFTTGDKIDLSAIDADSNGENGDTAFTFGVGAFTGAGQIRVLAFANNRYGVYLETTGNNVEDAIINVYSDHALAEGDFVL
jgi:Ca2+-binding RTX toxin-like protein